MIKTAAILLLSTETTTTAKSDLTPQQAVAIQTRAVRVALSAGAGCGKTYVLTRRFLSHLDPEFINPATQRAEPAELSQLVAITFTERAAREMRERIRSETLRRLQTASDSQADYWLTLWRSLEGARISTFHSFCATLLRSHAVEAQLDPTFVILEETTASTLLAEVSEDVLRSALVEQDPAAIELASEFGIEGTINRLLDMWSTAREHDHTNWLTVTPAELVARWQLLHRQEFLPRLWQALAKWSEFADLEQFLQRLSDVDPPVKKRRDELMQLLKTVREPEHAAATLPLLRATAMTKGLQKKQFANEDHYEQYKQLCSELRTAIDKIAEVLAPPGPAAERAATLALQLLQLAPRLQTAFTAAKQRENGLDFTDLQLQARQLLTAPQHSELQQRLRKNLRLLLVDECQDTDPIQMAILQALAGEAGDSNKLFVVGDFKQSIYRFRGADPQVFVDLRQATPAAGRLPLSRNFRSVPAVLQFVNLLFNDVLSTTHENYEPLQPARLGLAKQSAIEFLWSPADPARGNARANREQEARWLARRLRQLIDEQTPVITQRDGTARAAEPGDIAILFRALSDVQIYESALRECDLPYYLVGGHAFYAQQEIYDLLNLLRAVQSPADEIALAGVLRSPIFGLADEVLFWLVRLAGSLSAGLADATRWPSHWTLAERDAVQRVATTIDELRLLKDQLSIADLIRRALELTQYDAVLLAEFLGERKLANLEKLLEMARVFDRSSTLGLPDFLVQLTDFVVTEPRESLAATHPENTNVIKLMTIHKSKGLEFPIVVVPDLERADRGDTTTTLFDPLWGPLTTSLQSDEGNTGLTYCKKISSWANDQESLRLFYVATTRAADYLILSSGIGKMDRPKGAWLQLLASRFDLETGLSRLPPDAELPAPQIQVTKVEPPPPKVVAHQATVSIRKVLAELPTTKLPRQSDELAQQLASVAPRPMLQRRFAVSRLTAQIQSLQLAAGESSDETSTELGPALRHWHETVAWDDQEPHDDEPATERDPRQLGILVHRVLSRLTPQRCQQWTSETLDEVIQRAAEAEAIDQPKVLVRATELLQRFMAHARWSILQQSLELRTEVEFLLPWPDVTPTAVPSARSKRQAKFAVTPSPSIPYLLGYLDGLIQDQAGNWWIIDYKTSRVPRGAAAQQQLAEQYWPQLWVYGLAVEQALGVAPRGLILHFLDTGFEPVQAWDDARREQARAWLTEALSIARSDSLVRE